jgi:hypothetical protein
VPGYAALDERYATLFNSTTTPPVTGIRGRNVGCSRPTVGEVLAYRSYVDRWRAVPEAESPFDPSLASSSSCLNHEEQH